MASSSTPEVNYKKEVRFAVVMYGGVSLAIYINGVAQELLRLVRATAANGDGKALLSDEELSGSERVYRKLSYLLAQEPEDDSSAAPTKADRPIPTRFVVDTITGASAGGINGIFLAKALVRGQRLDQLQELWVREGAIEKLLNDRMSKESPVGFDNPPPALLNAKRLYFELLKAFDEMDGVRPDAAKQEDDTKASTPLVDELDLFVTTTDLHGAVLPMRLTDEVVFERRHKNVFRLVFPRDNEPQPDIDFLPETNPFLAYAARCTSSFPFAFEPMMLTDIDAILDGYGRYANDSDARSGSVRWSRFFRDYEKASGLKPVPPQRRAFADGGDLDNKPFGYAIDTLTRRHADYPITRKLIYVEPSPEHPEDEPEKDQRPNFLENAIDALSTLPMYETIREDLQRVSLRNRLIVRINRVLENVDKDMEKAIQSDADHGTQNVVTSIQANHAQLRDLTDDEWSKLYLDDMIKRKGRGYAAYHRLEIASVTDYLARIVTRGAGLNDDSDYFAVNRSLTRAWRGLRYSDYRDEPVTESGAPAPQPRHPINQFLTSFNLAYPLRRISFIRNRIEFLYCLDQQNLQETYTWPTGFRVNGQAVREFREELRRIYRELKKPENGLRKTERRLLSRPRPTDKPVDSRDKRHQTLNELSVMLIEKVPGGVRKDGTTDPRALLNYFLRGTKQTICDSPEAESDRIANKFLHDHPDVLAKMNEIAEGIADEVRAARKTAEDEAREVLYLNKPRADATAPQQIALQCLQHYYEDYDDYDMIIFPVLYETEVGEPALVDVFRVSPEDAKALIDERSSKCRKLAGTALAHFGAFLEKRWRENDIMWGQLDGAERIIASVLPIDHADKASLIGEAQAAIVYETIKNMGVEERRDLLCEALMRTSSGKPEPNLLVQVSPSQSGGFIDNLKNNAGPDLQRQLDETINNATLRDHYLDVFAKNSKPDTKSTLETSTRATTIVGKMFENLANDYATNGKKYAALITRIGQVSWGLVELASPKTIWNLLFHYWLKLLYLIELILIIGGTLLVRPTIQQFGFLLFALTLAVHLAVTVLNDLMRSRKRWLNLIKAALITLLIIIVGVGVASAAGLLGERVIWWRMVQINYWFTHPSGWRKWWLPALAGFFFVVSARHDFRIRRTG
jgi:patatin-related protein